MTLLLFGSTGFIGTSLLRYFESEEYLQGRFKFEKIVCSKSRLEHHDDVRREIEQVNPRFVINAAGLTGRPNVDWCEDHKVEVIRVNVTGVLNLFDVCASRSRKSENGDGGDDSGRSPIHLTNLATGCIYNFDDAHPPGSGRGFTEEDLPNYSGSFYSKTKLIVEDLSKAYPNILTLRLRMPISDDLHPRSLITKLIHYERVINMPNSVTIIHDLLPLTVAMTVSETKGIFNFVNPGAISHNEILELYKQHMDPHFSWKNFTLEEQSKILKTSRCNVELDATKLRQLAETLGFPVPNVKESMVRVFERMKKNHDNSNDSE